MLKENYASSVKTLNSFNPELQLKDTEYVIRNKLIDLMTKLKRFKFGTTMDLEFNETETTYRPFYLNLKASKNNY